MSTSKYAHLPWISSQLCLGSHLDPASNLKKVVLSPASPIPIFPGLPLVTTLVKLLELGEVREADELRTRMKVSDKRYWRIKIRGLAAAGSFEELNAFAIATWTPGEDEMVWQLD